MKTWQFTARYEVTKLCTISAETWEEAKDIYDAGEWDEAIDDCSCDMIDAEIPNWALFEDDE